MRLNLATRFAVQDCRPVPCPFGTPGVIFHIARIGVPDYQEFAQKNLSGNPLYLATMRAQTTAQLVAPPPSPEEIEKARAAGKTDQVAKLEAQLQRHQETLASSAQREVDRADLAALIGTQSKEAIEAVARFLIRNIEGLTDDESGTPVPVTYSPAVGVELLSNTVPISEAIFNHEELDAEGKPAVLVAVNTPLGQALRIWVIHEASKAEKYRAAVMERASGN